MTKFAFGEAGNNAQNATPCCGALFRPDPDGKGVRCSACYKLYDQSVPQQLARDRVAMGTYKGLKGVGYIVLEAGQYELEEYTDENEARRDAARMADKTGRAIIYAPIAVVKPAVRTDVEFEASPLALGMSSFAKLLGKPDADTGRE